MVSVNFMKKHRFFGMIIPEEFGGLGFSALGHSAVITKLASRSGTVAVTVMVPNSLGPGELLIHYGTDGQRTHYLPRLASGEDIPCFALTEPTAGSDAADEQFSELNVASFSGHADSKVTAKHYVKRKLDAKRQIAEVLASKLNIA